MPGMGVDEYRAFAREQQLRFERVMRDISRRTDEIVAEGRAQRAESREFFNALRERMDDLHAESFAQRQALLAILDRINGGGPAPASG